MTAIQLRSVGIAVSVLLGRHVVLGDADLGPGVSHCERVGAASWQAVASHIACDRNDDLLFVDGDCDLGRSDGLAALAQATGRTFRSQIEKPLSVDEDWEKMVEDLKGLLRHYFPERFGRHRFVTEVVLMRACNHRAGVPRSKERLLERLDMEHLRRVHCLPSASSADHDDVQRVREMCEELFALQGKTGEFDFLWQAPEVGYEPIREQLIREKVDVAGLVSQPGIRYLIHQYLWVRRDPSRPCAIFFNLSQQELEEIEIAEVLSAARTAGAGVVLLSEQ